MSRVDDKEMKKELKKAERRGRRKGWFARIRVFFVGILCGFLILTLVTSYVHGLKATTTFKLFFSREAAVEDHDLTLENHGILGYKAADFANAVLGEEKQLKKLEVYSVEVSDIATLIQAGLVKIKAFSKYQYVTYHGTATYTVDLSKLSEDDFALDEESKTVTLTVPGAELEPINIPSENIEFGEVQKNTIFAFGDIKLTPEEEAKVETDAKNRMIEKLEAEDAAARAAEAARHSIWEIFQPVISGVSPEYKLEVVLADPAAEEPKDETADDSGNGNTDKPVAEEGTETQDGTGDGTGE